MIPGTPQGRGNKSEMKKYSSSAAQVLSMKLLMWEWYTNRGLSNQRVTAGPLLFNFLWLKFHAFFGRRLVETKYYLFESVSYRSIEIYAV